MAARQCILILSVALGLCLSLSASGTEDDDTHLERGELAQLLAPIALYPDSVLTHILIAATYPLEVVQADRWARKNPGLKAAEALTRVENEHWDPSVKALVAFPRVLRRMSDDLAWTQKLGDAFLQDEAAVLDSIQSLRSLADDADNLDKMDKVSVRREEKIVLIEPVETRVIYLPYYDTRVVYGPWRWVRYPPVYWHHHYRHHHHHHRPFHWHAGIHISLGFYSHAVHWHRRHITITHRGYWRQPHNYRHRYRNHGYPHPRVTEPRRGHRWVHNPTHRRGVPYRTDAIRKRFNSSRPSRLHSPHQRHTDKRRTSYSRTNGGAGHVRALNHDMAKRHRQLREKLREHDRGVMNYADQPPRHRKPRATLSEQRPQAKRWHHDKQQSHRRNAQHRREQPSQRSVDVPRRTHPANATRRQPHSPSQPKSYRQAEQKPRHQQRGSASQRPHQRHHPR